MTFGTTEGGKQDALGNVQRDIESVRGIMTENIERVLERGERIDLLVDKTDRLGVGAHDFRVRSRGLKRQMWWKNVKLMVLLGVVVVFLVYLFVGFGCGLPGELMSFFCFLPFLFSFPGRRHWEKRDAFLGWKHCYSLQLVGMGIPTSRLPASSETTLRAKRSKCFPSSSCRLPFSIPLHGFHR